MLLEGLMTKQRKQVSERAQEIMNYLKEESKENFRILHCINEEKLQIEKM
jgi:hypothetical protein